MKIRALAGVAIGGLVLVAFFESGLAEDLWRRFFHPSSIALPFDRQEADKVAFMAQQPYQGYYGAWVGFFAALLAAAAAIYAGRAAFKSAKHTADQNFKAVREQIAADDRRAGEERLIAAKTVAAEAIWQLEWNIKSIEFAERASQLLRDGPRGAGEYPRPGEFFRPGFCDWSLGTVVTLGSHIASLRGRFTESYHLVDTDLVEARAKHDAADALRIELANRLDRNIAEHRLRARRLEAAFKHVDRCQTVQELDEYRGSPAP